jgi:competence protein ComEA
LVLADTESNATDQIVVHVSGKVLRPGLVMVGSNARVGDVIMAAGGALPDALLGEINLAAPVVDGGQVLVPGAGTTQATGGWSRTDPPDLVSLNRGTAQELEAVPGLGPVLAVRITKHRESNGPYVEVEDLLDVPGIGEKKLAALREYVVVP